MVGCPQMLTLTKFESDWKFENCLLNTWLKVTEDATCVVEKIADKPSGPLSSSELAVLWLLSDHPGMIDTDTTEFETGVPPPVPPEGTVVAGGTDVDGNAVVAGGELVETGAVVAGGAEVTRSLAFGNR